MSCGVECSERHTYSVGCDNRAIAAAPSGADHFRIGLRGMFAALGLDPDGEALSETPDRWLRALTEFTGGYALDPADVLGRTFEVEHSGYPISVTNVPFTSVCEHHLLPFSGLALITYLPEPGGRVVGLSKLPRLLDIYARRLQTQEQLTRQVTDALEKHLSIRGAACVIGSEHGCLANRGARKPGAVMVTGSFTGVYEDPTTRHNLLTMLGGPAAYR
jgi:GTP cyclohydrolase IA